MTFLISVRIWASVMQLPGVALSEQPDAGKSDVSM